MSMVEALFEKLDEPPLEFAGATIVTTEVAAEVPEVPTIDWLGTLGTTGTGSVMLFNSA
jgi:hypothetical protein